MDTPYKTVLNGCTVEVTTDKGWKFGCGRMPNPDSRVERCFVLVTILGQNTPRAVYYGPFSACLTTKEILVTLMRMGK